MNMPPTAMSLATPVALAPSAPRKVTGSSMGVRA